MGFPEAESVEHKMPIQFPRLSRIADRIKEEIGYSSTVFFALVDKQTNKSIVIAQSKSNPNDPDISSYSLENTPCRVVTTHGFCSFTEPADRFPLDIGLRKMEIRHYLGAEIPLSQRYNGLLVTLSKEPLPEDTIQAYFEMTGARNGYFAEAMYYAMRQMTDHNRTITMTELQHTTRNAMLTALVNRNKETARHCAVVEVLTLELAKLMNITDPDELDRYRYMALLHDIGKLRIPQYIIDKPGKLDAAEWEIMQAHAQYSIDILNETISLKGLEDGVLYHQEKWDGSGYPFGLKGEQIPLAARIIAGADKLAAIMEPRPYNQEIPTIRRMRKILKEMSGRELDPAIAKHLLALLKQKRIKDLLRHQVHHTERLLGPIFE